MVRWLALFSCALALGLMAPIAPNSAEAKSMKCKWTGMLTGKTTKWACKSGTKCCFNWIENKGGCVPASSICLGAM